MPVVVSERRMQGYGGGVGVRERKGGVPDGNSSSSRAFNEIEGSDDMFRACLLTRIIQSL